MLIFDYCLDCKREIKSYGGIAFEYFDFICEQYFLDSPLELSTSIHDPTHGCESIVRFLELKGFVITTESSQETIQVKPKDFFICDDGQHQLCYFCKHNRPNEYPEY